MNWTIAGLMQAMRLTLQDPAAGFRLLQAANPPLAARTGALLLLAVLSAIALTASVRLSPELAASPMGQAVLGSPFATAGIQWVVMLVTAVLIHVVGRSRGGTGDWADAVLAVVWVQAILLVFQVAQLVAVVTLPLLADLLGLASVFVFFWLIVTFIAVLHGFANRGLVLLGVILTIFAVSMLVSIVIVALFSRGAGNV